MQSTTKTPGRPEPKKEKAAEAAFSGGHVIYPSGCLVITQREVAIDILDTHTDGSTVRVTVIATRVGVTTRCRGRRIVDVVGRAQHTGQLATGATVGQLDDADTRAAALGRVRHGDRNRAAGRKYQEFTIRVGVHQVRRRIIGRQARVIGHRLLVTSAPTMPLAISRRQVVGGDPGLGTRGGACLLYTSDAADDAMNV